MNRLVSFVLGRSVTLQPSRERYDWPDRTDCNHVICADLAGVTVVC